VKHLCRSEVSSKLPCTAVLKQGISHTEFTPFLTIYPLLHACRFLGGVLGAKFSARSMIAYGLLVRAPVAGSSHGFSAMTWQPSSLYPALVWPGGVSMYLLGSALQLTGLACTACRSLLPSTWHLGSVLPVSPC
jgi:hypothetical protein